MTQKLFNAYATKHGIFTAISLFHVLTQDKMLIKELVTEFRA